MNKIIRIIKINERKDLLMRHLLLASKFRILFILLQVYSMGASQVIFGEVRTQPYFFSSLLIYFFFENLSNGVYLLEVQQYLNFLS